MLKTSSVASSGKIKLSWEAVEGAKEYKVYYSTSKEGTYKRLTTTANTSTTHISAVPGTTYYYKVMAVHEKSAANSAYSASKYRTCDLAWPEVEITLTANGNPRLTWNAVEGAVKYEVYRSTKRGYNYSKLSTTTKTSLTNTSVVEGTTYYYKVRAIHTNTSANSAYSTVVSIEAK